MAKIEYGKTGQKNLEFTGSPVNQVLLKWDADKDDRHYDKDARIIVQHAGSTDGVLLKFYRTIGTYQEMTHRFRMQNEASEIYTEGPFSGLLALVDGLSAGTTTERVTVTAIARTEG